MSASRLKSNRPDGTPLRAFAREQLANPDSPLRADAIAWFQNKKPKKPKVRQGPYGHGYWGR